MSFVVAHVQKLKSSALRGMQIHNQRESEQTMQNNPSIDPARLNLNYDLHTQGDVNYNRAVKERIAEGRVSDTAIRKDATVAVSILVSSDQKFFEGMTDERKREFFQAAYDYAAEKYGRENIVSARVHMDETTPHIHITTVPLTADGRLSARDLFTRQTLRELQDDLPRKLQSLGFEIERGQSKTETMRNHVEINEFKRQTLAQEVIAVRRSEIELHKQKAELESEIERVTKTQNARDKINAFEENKLAAAKDRLFGSDVHVDQESFKYLCKLARAGVAQRDELTAANQKVKHLTEQIKQDAPTVVLGKKTAAMQANDPQFKRQFQAAEVRREKTLAEKMANKMAQSMPKHRAVGLRVNLSDDDDEGDRKLKFRR